MTAVEFTILLLLIIIIAGFWWERYQDLQKHFDCPPYTGTQAKSSEEISGTLNSDAYLTADQVAAMLQVSKTTIYTWAGSGYIPALKIRGGSQKNVWRFSRRDVEAWIAEQKQPVTVKDLFTRKENADADTSAGTERGSV